jgi:hypothetical protein
MKTSFNKAKALENIMNKQIAPETFEEERAETGPANEKTSYKK